MDLTHFPSEPPTPRGHSSVVKFDVLKSEEGEKVLQRVIAPVRGIERVKTMQSVGRAWFGASVEGVLFRFGAKRKPYVLTLWMLWWIGNISGVLVLSNALPSEFIWTCSLMLPIPIICSLLLERDLLGELASQLEVQVLTIMQLVFVIAASLTLGDKRAWYWVCCWPTLYFSLFIDAYPAKYRAHFTLWLFASKAVIFISWDVIQSLGLCHPLQFAAWKVGHITMNCLSLTFSLSVTLLIFCYRHLSHIIKFPDRFAILKSPLQTIHEEMELVEFAEAEGKETRFALKKHHSAKNLYLQLGAEDMQEVQECIAERKSKHIKKIRGPFSL